MPAAPMRRNPLDNLTCEAYARAMRFPAALRQPQYRRYALGAVIAMVGLWAQRTVYAWLAWDLSGSASWVGLVAFLNFAPTLVSGPLFGVIADRVDLKRAALIVQTCQIVVSGALLAVDLAGLMSLAPLCLIAFVSGVVMSAHHPVRMALTPRLVPRRDLPNAVAISSVTFNVARLAGPAVGGALITGFGVSAALAVTMASFVPFMAVIAGLTPRMAEGPPLVRAGIGAALTEGVSVAWRTPLIRTAMLLTGMFALLSRGALEILPAIADGVFQRGAAGLGELMAAAGAGALAAAVTISGRDSLDGETLPRQALAVMFLGFALLAALGLAPNWPLAMAATAGSGFCGAFVGVTLQSVVQMNVGDAHRGRVMSLWVMVGIGAAAVGAILLGAAADLIGLPAALTAASLAGAAGAALILARR